MNELTLVVNDEALLKEITFNYDSLKSALDSRLKAYRSLTVTEDGIAAAKQDRAKLNKLEAALKDKQQEITKKLLGGFETKVKELRKMIADASKSIDDQIKYFDEQVKAQKKDEIKQVYEDSIGNLKELVSFEKLFEVRWLNKTYPMQDIICEIKERIRRIGQDIETLDALEVPENIAIAVKDYYLRTLDLSAALREKKRLEDTAAAMEKRKAAEELRRQTATAPLIAESSYEPEPIPEPQSEESEESEVEPIQQIDFRVWVTASQLASLRAFLKENEIKYGKAG